MENIGRERYISRIKPFIGNRNAKVLTGIRRSGKSTLLEMLSGMDDGPYNDIVLNMELWKNRELRNPDRLYETISSSLKEGVKNRLFIDEVQDVDEWESVIRSLIAEDRCDIYLTGSNSHLLSGEFASYLSGRLNIIDVFTLTFSECMEFERVYRGTCDEDAVLRKFLRIGGFPSTWREDYRESDANSEVSDIVYAIMMRDIVSRHPVKNPDALNRILRYICDNVGNPTSVNNIFNSLSSEGRGIGRDTVSAYVDHLENAYLIQKVCTFDLKGKRHLTSKYKYYLSDIGVKNAILGFRPDDIAGYMENIVFLELRSRGYSVWIGDNAGKEVDFVAEKNGGYVYVQVTVKLDGQKTIEREFGSLKGIDDNYPKYVVTLDDGPLNSDIDGIICCKLTDFLMKDEL